jgi:hypothetical protein
MGAPSPCFKERVASIAREKAALEGVLDKANSLTTSEPSPPLEAGRSAESGEQPGAQLRRVQTLTAQSADAQQLVTLQSPKAGLVSPRAGAAPASLPTLSQPEPDTEAALLVCQYASGFASARSVLTEIPSGDTGETGGKASDARSPQQPTSTPPQQQQQQQQKEQPECGGGPSQPGAAALPVHQLSDSSGPHASSGALPGEPQPPADNVVELLPKVMRFMQCLHRCRVIVTRLGVHGSALLDRSWAAFGWVCLTLLSLV